jgi:hypothetical protein
MGNRKFTPPKCQNGFKSNGEFAERERERGTYTSDDVGIDNRDAMGLEEIGDGALSRSDSTS